MTPEIILGPPGTGKTYSVLQIVEEELARGVHPDRIALVTFTRKGAREAAERAAKKFNIEVRDLRYFSTIHSHCFSSLGYSNGEVLEGKKMVEFGDWIGEKVSEHRSMDEGNTFGYEPADRALFMENLARVRCIPLENQYDDNSDGLSWSYVERIARGLKQFKTDRHLVDFTDMLSIYVEQGWSPTLEVLIVDECQDLSELQWRVIWQMARGCRRVVFAGDDDQTIYRWAGAALERFVDMPGEARVLAQSYRVPISVQTLAAGIIERVKHRRPKIWSPRQEQGSIHRIQRFEHADWNGDDVLVLGRNAYVLNPLMAFLRREGIVFEWRGHNSVSGKTLRAVENWELLRKGEAVTVDEAQEVYQLMSSGTGVKRGFKTLPGLAPDAMVGMGDLRERGGLMVDGIWHVALDRIPTEERGYLIRARKRGESLKKKPRVRVSTIHGIKGGEGEHVVILRDMAPRTFQEMRTGPDDEHRVQYVGVTRTKSRLTIVAPRTNMNYAM